MIVIIDSNNKEKCDIANKCDNGTYSNNDDNNGTYNNSN